ncbi:MAG: hypothetical protein JST00_38105 [Deltaproteobacteria bacterium]|nr:hypothetical protein [Deltaproteobacteria bacterium]
MPIVSLLLAVGAPAYAQATPSDRVAAEALFDEAVRLMKAGDFATACPKLLESQRLDAGVGTLVYLAECYSRSGKTASAWAIWREASAAARAAGQTDRERMAKQRAEALEPELPRVVISVGPSPAPGLEIKRDGVVVAQSTWALPMPVDPGEHTFVASAAGKRPWTSTVQFTKAQKVDLAVPALEDEVTAAPVSPPVEGGSAGWSTQRWIGLGVAGAGVIALGVGAVFGARASSIWSDVEARCPDNRCTDPTAPSDVEDARSAGNVSSALIIGGAALVAGGAVLWLTAPSRDRLRGIRVTPSVDRSSAFISVGGAL